jgi:hypothetical protein
VVVLVLFLLFLIVSFMVLLVDLRWRHIFGRFWGDFLGGLWGDFFSWHRGVVGSVKFYLLFVMF